MRGKEKNKKKEKKKEEKTGKKESACVMMYYQYVCMCERGEGEVDQCFYCMGRSAGKKGKKRLRECFSTLQALNRYYRICR